MAMDFPVSPVDRLPIFPDEAASAAALKELIGGGARGEDGSANVPVTVVNTVVCNSGPVTEALGGQQFSPGYAPRRQVSSIDKGKGVVVPKDPIIEALAGVKHCANDPRLWSAVRCMQHPWVTASSSSALICPKSEIREKYPGKLVLHPEEPIGLDVLGYHDKMERCSTLDFARRKPMWRLLRKEEAKLFAGLPERFRLGVNAELMEAERSTDLDFDYIATMLTEEHTGVKIKACKETMLLLKYRDSWAVYAIDFEKKICLVMDPVETEERQHEMEAKTDLEFVFAVGEESWIYGMHYLRDYTGEKVTSLSDSRIEYLGKSLVYQLLTMQENRAVLPYCMREESDEQGGNC